MNYSQSNKEAWEEAYEHRSEGFDAEDIVKRIRDEKGSYFEDEVLEVLKTYDLQDKTVGQFCCNNGRELLSLMTFGAKEGIGFDIAENMVATANKAAEILGANCKFHATDILTLDETYNNCFDFIIVTIGALTWFEDLTAFFAVASRCLKRGGALLVNEMHPLTNMIALKGEEGFDPNDLKKLVHSYFKSDPWIDNDGIEYLTHKKYESKTLYCFSHTLSALLNALANNSFCLTRFDEFDHDISEGFEALDHQGFPLSYLLTAIKQ